MSADLVLDISLAAMTLWVAWRALAHRDLFVSVVLFIAFGLLMSLVWVRLGAVDIALAEATIGAGITGALLLDTVRVVSRRVGGGREADPGAGRDGTCAPDMGAGADGGDGAAVGSTGAPRVLAALLTGGLAVVLTAVVVRLQQAPGGLTRLVAENLGAAGVQQPVTAVLMAFRAYDTLLETCVLLLAGAGLLAVRRTRHVSQGADAPLDDPVLGWLVRLLVPVMVLTGGHLLFLGTRGAGGGFQAGALLGAAAILLLLGGHASVAALHGTRLRAALMVGPAVFLAVGVSAMASDGRLLELRPPTAPALILVVEAALAAATAITLAVLFAGARPGRDPGMRARRSGHSRRP